MMQPDYFPEILRRNIRKRAEEIASKNGKAKHSLEDYRFQAGRVAGLERDAMDIIEESLKELYGDVND